MRRWRGRHLLPVGWSAFAFAAMLGGDAARAEPGYVTITNVCDRTVALTIWDVGADQTRGWYLIDPRASIAASAMGDSIGYYAMTVEIGSPMAESDDGPGSAPLDGAMWALPGRMDMRADDTPGADLPFTMHPVLTSGGLRVDCP
jgi:hypothetical protein